MASCAIGDFNKLECKDNLLNVQDIMNKINEMLTMGFCLEDCCAMSGSAVVIRSLLVGDRLYLTSDGSKPIEVAFNGSEPIDTYLNTTQLEEIYFMGTFLREMYMDGDVVFRGVMELDLTQHESTINLMTFIKSHDLKGFKIIQVTNNLVQPAIESGNTSGFEVSLINKREFQGISSSGDGLTVTSPLLLDNTNGYIRGAGGDGGDGGGYDLGDVPSSVSVWTAKAGHDDGGPYTVGVMGGGCIGGTTTAHFNRFWKTAGGAKSGAWINTLCTNSFQEYWDAGTSPIWGDQGRCHTVKHGYKVRTGGGINLQVIGTSAITIVGGRLGNGGRGKGYKVSKNSEWTSGVNGSYTGPSSGFDDDGINYDLPSQGSFTNGDGGIGGGWAEAGTDGTNAGTIGKSAGRAIVGSSYLKSGSTTGNVNGAIV